MPDQHRWQDVRCRTDSRNFATEHRLIAQVIAAESAGAKILDNSIWPDNVKDDVAKVRDTYFEYIPLDQEVQAATSIDGMKAVVYPDVTLTSAASQRLRSRLGLPSDQYAGC